ncbi:hypothetical protein CYY_002058 [Polysphondylium violaceum]|uniref:Phospholipase A-2-activating protein n=1 Tax=Polysphondylium violaceum TaxID=133409 RepID=A0A8J4Q271_9MYCE|nr:hypothetical protein CYY_002058 [Polysphondylium violaceum]
MTTTNTNTIYKLSKELFGHTKDVRSTCVLSDGRVVTGSRDNSIKVWDPLVGYSNPLTLTSHSHFVGTLVPLPPSLTLRERCFASGGNDKVICVWEKSALPRSSPSSNDDNNNNNNNNSNMNIDNDNHSPSLILLGHTDTVSTLGATMDGLLISGSWDKTIKIWENGECVDTLEGHEHAIWSVLGLPNGTIVSASADKTIKIWEKASNNKYKVTKTLSNHKDCVRGLALIPELGFVSCGNDGKILVWTFDGECIQEIPEAHGSYIYAVVVVPGVGFATCGEDRALKLWKDGECIQTITHPSGIWDLSVSPNGDIITACSDSVARVWTRNPNRFANENAVKAFEDVLGAQTIMSDNVGDIKLSELPDIKDGLLAPGKKEGELKVVKNGTVAEAHQWTDGKWVKIGDVVDSNAAARGGKKELNGVEYDYVFDVDISEGVIHKLGYNLGQNPWQVAHDWLNTNELNPEFVDQVAEFIIKNTDQSSANFSSDTNASLDPLTGGTRYVPGSSQTSSNSNNGGYVDPFTGGNRYVPGTAPPQITSTPTPAPAPAPTQKSPPNISMLDSNAYIPAASYKPFESPNSDALITKVVEFNAQLASNPDTSSVSLDDNEINLFKDILRILKETSRYHSSQFSDIQYEIIFRMLRWPEDKVYAPLDVVRLLVLHSNASKTFEQLIIQQQRIPSSQNIIQRLLNIPANTTNLNNQILLLKIFTNIHRHDTLRKFLTPQLISQLLDRFGKQIYYQIKNTNKNYSISWTSFLLNLSILSQYTTLGNATLAQLLESIETTILTESDKELLFKTCCALGTLLYNNRDLVVKNKAAIKAAINQANYEYQYVSAIDLLFKLIN